MAGGARRRRSQRPPGSHTAWETWTALEFGGTANAPNVAAVCAFRTEEVPPKPPLPGPKIGRGLQRPLLTALDPRSVDRLEADAVALPDGLLDHVGWWVDRGSGRRPRRGRQPRARRWWPLPVMAVIVALAGAVVLSVSRPGPVEVAPGPSGSTTQPTPTPIVTSAPVVEAPPEPVPQPEPTANVVSEPAPVPVPAPSSPSPSARTDTRQAPPPPVRSPNSVSPEPRPAFPNQRPPDGDGGPGGLLGRLGL